METFSALLAICADNSLVTGEFPTKGQGRGALMFSLICAWINGWVNNRVAGDLRRNGAHYDVILMLASETFLDNFSAEKHIPPIIYIKKMCRFIEMLLKAFILHWFLVCRYLYLYIYLYMYCRQVIVKRGNSQCGNYADVKLVILYTGSHMKYAI